MVGRHVRLYSTLPLAALPLPLPWRHTAPCKLLLEAASCYNSHQFPKLPLAEAMPVLEERLLSRRNQQRRETTCSCCCRFPREAVTGGWWGAPGIVQIRLAPRGVWG